MNKLKVRFISNFPLSIVYGGFEHQCVQTCKALKSIGVDADLLDWHYPEQNNYILHLFAPDPMWARIVEHWGQRGPVVISAIAGTRGFRRRSYLKNKFTNYFAQVLLQETIFSRTRRLLHRADKIVCLNSLEQDYFVRNYDLSPDKTVIISNGVDESRYSTPGDIFTDKFGLRDFVLYVGNITQRKNPLLLAECLKQSGLKGVFIGQGMPLEIQYGEAFQKLIDDSPNLMWIPGLDYNDPLLGSAFAAAKVLCLPSLAETQPLVAMEAMGAGKPVILGDFPYAHQHPFEPTIKVNPTNKEELISAIQNAMKQKPADIAKLSNEYLWGKVAEKMAQVYSVIWREFRFINK